VGARDCTRCIEVAHAVLSEKKIVAAWTIDCVAVSEVVVVCVCCGMEGIMVMSSVGIVVAANVLVMFVMVVMVVAVVMMVAAARRQGREW
jgi:hypothetical protein